jgi:dTDP-4-dehydrorhamnose reductase
VNTALVTGAGGQLGRALLAQAATGWDVRGLARADCDITDPDAVAVALEETGATLLINAAAYTAVDRAEEERDRAFATNATAPAQLAAACAKCGARLLHVSTDFVFDGTRSTPYPPAAPTAPLGVYGASKLAGEEAVLDSSADSLVLRTGWVYAPWGSNFLRTMLRLQAEREELAVVADQVGTPTAVASLARALWSFAAQPGLDGIWHWSDAGVCSWYDFAVAIAEEASALGLLDNPAQLRPIATEDYPTPARRPAYSVLDKRASWAALGYTAQHWRVQLRETLAELGRRENSQTQTRQEPSHD